MMFGEPYEQCSICKTLRPPKALKTLIFVTETTKVCEDKEFCAKQVAARELAALKAVPQLPAYGTHLNELMDPGPEAYGEELPPGQLYLVEDPDMIDDVGDDEDG